MRAVRCFPTVTCGQSQCYSLCLICALYMFLCISHSHNKIEKLRAIKKNYVEMLFLTSTTETMPGTEKEPVTVPPTKRCLYLQHRHSSIRSTSQSHWSPALSWSFLYWPAPPTTWMTAPYFNFRPLCLPRRPPASPETASHPPLCSHRTCWLNYNCLFTYSLSPLSLEGRDRCFIHLHIVSHT